MKNKSLKTKSVKSFFLNNMLLIAIISIIGSGFFWISSEYSEYRKQVKHLQENFIANQKSVIQNEVYKTLDLIDYRKKQTETRLQNNIKIRVYEAIAIAANIYEENKNDKTKFQIEKMIKDALRPIRFNNGRGYFFAVTMTGIEKLYPVAPQFEEQNLLNLQDTAGNFVIRDEIKIVKEFGEGFARDFWRKPDSGDDMIYPKITFVKYFKPLNWYIGTGEYLDDVEKDIQKESLERISNIRFGKSGYVFVNKYDGEPLISEGEIVTEQKNLWEHTDSDGIKVFQIQLEAAKKPEGDFIHYSWKKMGKENPEKKISFIRGFPDWDWVIGAGFYSNDIEPEIIGLNQQLEKRVRVNMLKILLVLIILMFTSYIITRVNYIRLKKNFQIFLNFFHDAAHKSLTIDINHLSFQEFISLAESANRMIETKIKADTLLKESEEKYKMVVTNQGEGVVLLDMNKNFLFANPAAEKICGVSTNGLYGRNFNEFIVETYEHRSHHFETRIKTEQGEMKDLLVTSTNHENENGNMQGTLEIFRDITFRKAIERERDENRERLKLINRILRHDITNNLTVIKSALKIFFRNKNEEVLKDAMTYADKSVKLISEMRKQEEMVTVKNLKMLNINKFISETMKSYPELDYTLTGECTVFADDSVNSVIDNIVRNAIMHGHATKMEISVIEHHEYCQVSFSDNGIGIPEKIADKIFDEGFKYGETGNTGIGLFIVKKTMENYEGTVTVKNNKPQGAIFTLEFRKTLR
jgi:PAS domain S-box-containing protein